MDHPLRLGLTFAAWIGATVLVSAAALALGADARRISEAAVAGLAPPVVGFILLHRLEKSWARVYLIFAWTLSAALIVASSGGAMSPALALFAAAPAFALLIGGRALIVGAVLASAAGFAAAAWLSRGVESAPLGWAPTLYAIAAVLLCGLIFLTRESWRKLNGDDAQHVAEVAHELRTPLSHMIGFAEMIEKELYGPIGERNREYAGLIRTSGMHLLDLIGRRLDLSRMGAGRYDLYFEVFDARDIAAEVMRLSQGSAAAKNITLAQDLYEYAIMVRADRDAVRQILTNLLGNAVKFTPEGGSVQLTLRVIGARLHLEVSDSGPGVARADRSRVLRPFERSASAHSIEGAGLGLALVHALARMHGGELRLGQAPAGGLLASVRLPLAGPK